MIFRHLAPDRLHVEQTADGSKVFSPKRKDWAPDFPIGVFEIVRYVFSASAITLVISADALFNDHHDQIVALASRYSVLHNL